jgi:hypothetical protein
VIEGAPLVPGPELVAVAALWRASGRQIVTSFLGTSMLPTIAPGVEVRIDCASRGQVGDVLAYVSGEALIVHRIEAITADSKWVLTRGDHRIIPDDPFDRTSGVIGTIVAIRSGSEWISPPAAPRGRLRLVVLRFVLHGFRLGLRSCRRRLLALRALIHPSIVPSLVVAKLRRTAGNDSRATLR